MQIVTLSKKELPVLNIEECNANLIYATVIYGSPCILIAKDSDSEFYYWLSIKAPNITMNAIHDYNEEKGLQTRIKEAIDKGASVFALSNYEELGKWLVSL